jgi:CheY-like chemotaxis protein
MTCRSGEETLSMIDILKPDLVLLDIEMLKLNGYDTCKKLRALGHTMPIIFVTGHYALEEQVFAYEAGGNDLVTKPVPKEILLHKIDLAFRVKAETEHLQQEAQSLRDMAMSFLSTAGDSGVLLNFVRKAASATSFEQLAKYLIAAADEFGVSCSVMIRHDEQATILTPHGNPNELEQAILDKMSKMGRIFQFQGQIIVNYDQVSLMVNNAPLDSVTVIGRIRDNITILAETAEALCESVSMRIQSVARAEQMQVAQLKALSSVKKLRVNNTNLLLDSRILLQELVDEVEKTYSWLGTSASQEVAISETMDKAVQRILAVLATGAQFDEEISTLLEVLEGEKKAPVFELF